jgi:hypothetical protein
MENTITKPTYLCNVEFDWHYPGQPVSTVVYERYFQTDATDINDVAEKFVDSFIKNYQIGVCTTSNVTVIEVKRVFTFDDWVEKYNPVQNDISESSSFEGYAFDYCTDCGDPDCISCMEWDFVKKQDPDCVWTLVTEGDDFSLISGFHWVNRHCYFVSSKSVEKEDLSTEFVVIE